MPTGAIFEEVEKNMPKKVSVNIFIKFLGY